MVRNALSSLTDDELRNAYFELKEWMNTGVLKGNGLVRKIHSEWEAKLKADIDLRMIEKKILYEIADRFSRNETNPL